MATRWSTAPTRPQHGVENRRTIWWSMAVVLNSLKLLWPSVFSRRPSMVEEGSVRMVVVRQVVQNGPWRFSKPHTTAVKNREYVTEALHRSLFPASESVLPRNSGIDSERAADSGTEIECTPIL